MNKVNLIAVLLLLMGGVTLAAIYRWTDESGRVHYGDSPPSQSDVQSVDAPEAPTEEEVERARKQMRKKIEQYEDLSKEIYPPESPEKPAQHANNYPVITDDAACFSSLPEITEWPSANTYKNITYTTLNNTQKETLLKMFRNIGGAWRGTITDLACMGTPTRPVSRITNYDARTTIHWDSLISQLSFKTDSKDQERHEDAQFFHIFAVGDALYFNDRWRTDTIIQEGSEVKVINITSNIVSFIIIRRIYPSGKQQVEIRYLDISGGSLKLTELYFNNGLLTGSRVWMLYK